MANADGGSQFSVFFPVDWLGLTVGGHLALSLHSSDEPDELSRRL